jgi:hypothetical protein
VENALEKWDSMKQAIEEAKIVPEVSRIRDKAETTRHVLRLAGESPEVVRKVEEIKLRAERRARARRLGEAPLSFRVKAVCCQLIGTICHKWAGHRSYDANSIVKLQKSKKARGVNKGPLNQF